MKKKPNLIGTQVSKWAVFSAMAGIKSERAKTLMKRARRPKSGLSLETRTMGRRIAWPKRTVKFELKMTVGSLSKENRIMARPNTRKYKTILAVRNCIG